MFEKESLVARRKQAHIKIHYYSKLPLLNCSWI